MYKPITENPLVIDFSSVKTYDELHDLLKEKFGFPEYYGKNLDALWDCIGEVFIWGEKEERTIELYGVSSIREDLQNQMSGILRIFQDVHAENPKVKFIIKS